MDQFLYGINLVSTFPTCPSIIAIANFESVSNHTFLRSASHDKTDTL